MAPSLVISRDERKSIISSDGKLNKGTSLHFPLKAIKSHHIDLKLIDSGGNINTRTGRASPTNYVNFLFQSFLIL
jgi:hypothetical protein